jgi:hypothetical protein
MHSVDLLGHQRFAIRAQNRDAVVESLRGWALSKGLEHPGIAFAAAKRDAPGLSLYEWASSQNDSGRGILLRGNPFATAPGSELMAYATRYWDLGFAGPAVPYILLDPPRGWRHTNLPDASDDPRPATSQARVASGPRLVFAVIALATVGFFVWALGRTKGATRRTSLSTGSRKGPGLSLTWPA